MLLVVRNPLANSRDMRRNFDPWVGKIFAGGNVNPYQYSCLENSMDRGAWWAIVHGITKSQTRLSTHAGDSDASEFCQHRHGETLIYMAK